MDINTLITNIPSAISSSVELNAWSNTTYGQNVKVYTNIDVRNSPGEDDCPYVVIYPKGKTVGQTRREKFHSFEVICCVYDETSRTRAESNIIEYLGVSRVETFRKHVENAVAGVDIGNGEFELIDVEYETIESFPYILAGMLVRISEPVTIGSNPLT